MGREWVKWLWPWPCSVPSWSFISSWSWETMGCCQWWHHRQANSTPASGCWRWQTSLHCCFPARSLGGVASLAGLILPPLIALFALSTSLSAPVLNYICIWILHIGESNIWLSVKNAAGPAAVFDMQMCEINLRLNDCHCVRAIVLHQDLMHRTSRDRCWLIACCKSSPRHWDIKGLTSSPNEPPPPPLCVILCGPLQGTPGRQPNEMGLFK